MINEYGAIVELWLAGEIERNSEKFCSSATSSIINLTRIQPAFSPGLNCLSLRYGSYREQRIDTFSCISKDFEKHLLHSPCLSVCLYTMTLKLQNHLWWKLVCEIYTKSCVETFWFWIGLVNFEGHLTLHKLTYQIIHCYIPWLQSWYTSNVTDWGNLRTYAKKNILT
jgi:hypothetical protein